jgi:hypothetical protein
MIAASERMQEIPLRTAQISPVSLFLLRAYQFILIINIIQSIVSKFNT